jgi:hypothetical protein
VCLYAIKATIRRVFPLLLKLPLFISLALPPSGILSVPLCRDTSLECFLSEGVETLSLHLCSHRQSLVQFRRNSKIELAGILSTWLDSLLLADLKKNLQ